MYFISPYSKKKTLKTTDIVRFPWEKIKGSLPTEEEKKQLEEKLKRWERFKPNG